VLTTIDKLGPAELAEELAALRPELLAAALSLLPVELMVAVRCGAEVALARADHELAELIAQDFAGGKWHRQHPLPRVCEIDRLRWPPTGDRDLWVRYGPAGPPWWRDSAEEAA
jgi:hypothetical protein